VDNLLVICPTVDSRFKTDNIAKTAKSQIHHRNNHLFFDFSLFRYKATKTTTIQTKAARESVATIHAIRTTKARIDRTVSSFFLILFVKNHQTSGRNATKKYQ
jgi:hypothetical protein